MKRPRSRWVAAGLLVGLGWLVTPDPVAIYDGISQPDEPYRYVRPPSAGPAAKSPPSSAVATTPVAGGASANGLSITTAEVGPQLAIFLPAGSFAAPGGTVVVKATPQAPAGQPPGARIDGNVYLVTVTDTAGPVSFTPKAGLATIYLRATTAAQPGPVMEHRVSPNAPWRVLQTTRGGSDVYVAALPSAGEYALAFLTGKAAGSHSGPPVLPVLLVGVLVLLAVAVVVVRLRSRATPA